MLPGRHFITLAFHALLRNRMQTALAMIGVMVGVAALVTSLALGRGAQEAVEDQLRAAGANLIVVTAGNYAKEKEERSDPDGNIGHTGALDPRDLERVSPLGARMELVAFNAQPFRVFKDRLTPQGPQILYPMPYGYVSAGGAFAEPARSDAESLFLPTHFEDDPLEIHDHPTAKDRLGDMTAGLGSAATMTVDDATAVAALARVQHVVAGVHENARIFVGDDKKKQWFTRYHGTEWALPELRSGWSLIHGRFLSKEDADKKAQVMVLGKVVSDRLFGEGVNPVGRTTTMWNQPFKVIGVLSSRSWASSPVAGDDQFDAVYVPVTTINGLLNLSKLNTISLSAKSVGDVSQLAKEVKLLLRKRHKISEEAPDDFTVTTVAQQAIGKGIPPQLARIIAGNLQDVDKLTIEQMSSSLKRTNVIMLIMLAGVATISLLVGGIGVMNLLLLSVTQRTREVGLRIALGARRSDIATQFVLEALLLCIIGGVLGIVAGVLASGGLQRFFDWSASISPTSAFASLIVAALLGVVFSVYPARRAALLDPIEALRHE